MQGLQPVGTRESSNKAIDRLRLGKARRYRPCKQTTSCEVQGEGHDKDGVLAVDSPANSRESTVTAREKETKEGKRDDRRKSVGKRDGDQRG